MKKILLLSLLSLSFNAFASNEPVDRVENQFKNPSTFFINGKDANTIISTTEVVKENGEKKKYNFTMKDTYNSTYQVKYELIRKDKNNSLSEFMMSSVKGSPMIINQGYEKEYVSKYSVDAAGKEDVIKEKMVLGVSVVGVILNKGNDLVLEQEFRWSELVSLAKTPVNEEISIDLPTVKTVTLSSEQKIELGKEMLMFENDEKKVIVTVNKV